MSERERLAASMVCAGFGGHVVDGHADRLLRRGVGAMILFARNVAGFDQVRELNRELAARRRGGGVIRCVDQEGGPVARLTGDGFTAVPPMRAVADAGAIGDLLGRDCRAAGFDLNFAPVLDVDTNPANPVIGPRSFGRDPHEVAAKGVAFIDALQRHVAACGKHFPGHGDADADSHHALPVVRHDLGRLRAVELVPFRAAVAAGVAAVMTAHVVFPALDDRPATLSGAVLGLLRADMGYDGVIVSDDFEMGALAGRYDFEESVRDAALAGCDLLNVCHTEALQHRAIDALAGLPLRRLREANRRLDAVRARYCRV